MATEVAVQLDPRRTSEERRRSLKRCECPGLLECKQMINCVALLDASTVKLFVAEFITIYHISIQSRFYQIKSL